MSEQIPDPVAVFDQILRASVDVAIAVRAYYIALRDAGFAEEEAFRLTMSYQSALFTAGCQ